MAERLTKENFIEKARKIHGNKYDYSKVTYINNHTKICIICPIHGEFWQKPMSHLSGCGCKSCGIDKSAKNRTISKEEFIEKARKIHGDRYDYSKVEYINAKTKVCIICPIHGEFWQTPLNHLNSNGCNDCGKVSSHRKQAHTNEIFIENARKIHGDKYDYSKVKYVNAYTNVCIICPIHGEFWQRPMEHLNGCGCPKCRESHLERDIREILEKNKIEYIYQCSSRNLKWLGRQSLDFYLPKYGLGIECQGIQHFIEQKNDLYEHRKTVERDIKKYIKCMGNNVKLLYYSDMDFNKKILIYNDENSFTNKEKIIEKIRFL